MTALYDNDRAYSVSWLVYINGLEVPAAYANVAYGVWQMPEAAITLVPDPVLQRLGAEDRVQTQIFYCDQWHKDTPEFCLCFDGEIVGWSYTSVNGGRALTFHCADYAAILTQLFFFFMSSFDDIAVGTSAAAMGVDASTVQTPGYGALYPYSLFSQGLADPGDTSANNATIKRPVDFAYNIVRSLIKHNHPNRPIPATNFFAPWVKRTNFHRRWVALPYIDQDPDRTIPDGVFPILRAVQADAALQAVARQAASIGTSGSLWALLSEILKSLMMEVAMIPTPAFVRSDFTTLLPRGPGAESYSDNFLTNYFVKPQFLFGLPPLSNVFFPSQIQSYAYQENYATQPTRMYFNEETLLSFLNPNASSQYGALGQLAQDALCTGYPEEVDLAARDASDARGQNGKNLLVWPEEFFKGPVIDRRAMPRWFPYLLQALGTNPPQPAPSPGPTDDTDTTMDDDDAPQTGGGRPRGAGGNAASGRLRRATFAQPAPLDAAQRPLTPELPTVPPALTAAVQAAGSPSPADLQRVSYNQNTRTDVGRRPGGVPQHPVGANVVQFGGTTGAEQCFWASTYGGDPSKIGEAVPPQRWPLDVNRGHAKGADPRLLGTSAYKEFPPWFLFGQWRERNSGGHRIHKGHDIVVAQGATIYSTTDGVVRKVYNNQPRQTAHQRNNPNAEGFGVSITDRVGAIHNYYHMRDLPLVRVGQQVRVGDPIGVTGTTGVSTGPHLHYDIISTTGYALDYSQRLLAYRDGNLPQAGVVRTGQGAPTPGAETIPILYGQPGALNTTGANDTGAPTAAAPVDAAARLSSARDLFRVYAMYEYYRERYARRQGTVTLAFTPYVLPGFPCLVFDRRSTALDVMGYVMSVQLTFSAGTWSTTVSFNYGRTLQELFGLIQRTTDLDNARLALQRAEIENTVRSRGTVDGAPAANEEQLATSLQQTDERLAQIGLPVGAVASAPPEPLAEVRGLIQDVRKAGEFYKSLFFQGVIPGGDRLVSEQFAQQDAGLIAPVSDALPVIGRVERQDNETPGAFAQRQLSAMYTYLGTAQATIERNRREGNRIALERNQAGQAVKQGVCDYLKLITLVDSSVQTGNETSGQGDTRNPTIEGFDAATAARMLDIIGKARRGTATEEELAVFRSATGWADFGQPPAGQNLPEPTKTRLDSIEINIRTQNVRTNVTGSVSIVPQPHAQVLFESYTAAMSYSSRPVCTLDEYIRFLGENGRREGEILPGQAASIRNGQRHPAPFYTRIRKFRPGPPETRPPSNLTNTTVATDAPAGGHVPVPETASTPPTPTTPPAVPTPPATPPATQAQTYTERAEAAVDSFIDSAQRTAARVGTAMVGAVAETVEAGARAVGATETADRARNVAAAAQTANEALRAQTTGPNARQSAVDESVVRAASAATQVQGIPPDFPDTRANWDVVLEEYRRNVLNKLTAQR